MRLALVLAILVWAALAGSASADVYDDNPATASRGHNDQWAFVRAGDGAIYSRHFNGSAWSTWESLGGAASSGPAAVAYGTSMLVFARGADGAVHQQTFSDGKWSGWVSLGGYATSAPAVTVRRGPERYIDLAVRGGDNTIHHQSFIPGRGWSGWASIGGNLTSAPALNSQANGLLNIWSRATDGSLTQKSWTGAAWTDWSSLGGGIIGAPGTISRTENILNVYVRGGGNTLYQRAWTASGWIDWIALDPAPMDSAPAAGADSANREYLFARGAGGLMRKEWNAGTGWGTWTDFGPIALPPAPAPPAPAPTATPIRDGSVDLETGVRCTPPGGKLRVSIKVRTAKGKAKARVSKIVFYTKGKGRKIRSDRRSPFVVRIPINRPAGSAGRVYARVYYRRSAKGKLHRKTVSRRYTVCR